MISIGQSGVDQYDDDLAQRLVEADKVLLTGSFDANGDKVDNSDTGNWDTNLVLIDLVDANDDTVDGGWVKT